MQRFLTSSLLVSGLLLSSMQWPAAAAAQAIGGDKLRLTDPGTPAQRRFFFRSIREPQILAATLDDPRVFGAMIEVTGSNAGDGATGVLMLPPALWKGLGRPPGSTGYLYYDHDATAGVTKVLLRPGQPGGRGGTLAITGRGVMWPYQITQPQGAIDVRFAVGTTVYCAQFVDLAHNRIGNVQATRAAPPATCD